MYDMKLRFSKSHYFLILSLIIYSCELLYAEYYIEKSLLRAVSIRETYIRGPILILVES